MLRAVAYSFHLTVSLYSVYLLVSRLCPHLTSVQGCIPVCLVLDLCVCVCVCEICNAFHSGCSLSSAITQHCSQFVVDLALSPSISG